MSGMYANHNTLAEDTDTSAQKKIMSYTLRHLEEKDLPIILEWRNSEKLAGMAVR